MRGSKEATSAAAVMERAKIDKYRNYARAINAEFIPFILESHGAMGSGAKEVLQRLADHAGKMRGSPGEVISDVFIKRARRIISITLQRGNAWALWRAERNGRRRSAIGGGAHGGGA